MNILSAAVLSSLGSSLSVNAGALLANENCYKSGINSDGMAYPYTLIELEDKDGFHCLGFSKVKTLFEDTLALLSQGCDNTTWNNIETLYCLVSKRCAHADNLKQYFQQHDLGVKVVLIKGDSCSIVEILQDIRMHKTPVAVLAYDNLNEPAVLSELFADKRVKHEGMPEGTVPGEVMCGLVIGEVTPEQPSVQLLNENLEVEVDDAPGKIVRANALVKAIKSLFAAHSVEYHDLSIRFADLNGESPRHYETAISNGRLQIQPMTPRLLSLNTVTPCGDAGCASGVLQLALLYGASIDDVLRRKIALRSPSLALHQIYGEDGRRAVMLSQY